MSMEKMSDQHFKALFFSNTGDKILIIVGRQQICPTNFHFFMTLSPGLENNNTLKCCFGIFFIDLDIYGYVGKLQEHHFSLWLFPNLGEKLIIFVKARISELNIYVEQHD